MGCHGNLCMWPCTPGPHRMLRGLGPCIRKSCDIHYQYEGRWKGLIIERGWTKGQQLSERHFPQLVQSKVYTKY